MGCKCSQVAPIIEPVKLEKPYPTRDPSPIKPTTDESELKGKRRTSVRDEEIARIDENRESIRSPTNRPPSNTDFVEIELADPQAFSNLFIQQRQKAIDNQSYRSTIESWRPTSLVELASAIQSLSRNKPDVDRHWIIFYWIACNIAYDTVSYFSKNYADQSAEGVFQTKKGVCAGYANIYKYLCDQLNVPCERISGYAKGYGFDQRENAKLEIDHAWNAVQINDHWYLMESTWGAGQLNEQKLFERELDTYYFFPRPNEMIYHHLPEDEKWQFLRQPITQTQYIRMPQVHPAYFELQLDIINPRHQAYVDLLPSKSYALVLVRAPSDVHLIADLKLDGNEIEGGHQVILNQERQVWYCYFAPNAVGKHKITIFGRKGHTDVGKYSAAIDLTLNVNHKINKPISFPKTWKSFFDLKLEVITPKETHLIKIPKGEAYTEILIRAPDDVELLGKLKNTDGQKIEYAHQVFYDRHHALWRCKFAPNHNGMFEAAILAKKNSDSGLYTSAVTFRIEAKEISVPPWSFPETWQLFHDLDLKIEAPLNRGSAVWPENASYSEVRISAPDDVTLSCTIKHNDVQEDNCTLSQFDHHKQQWQLLFAPQRTGLHELTIFAKRQADAETSSSGVVQFSLNVLKLHKPIRFPVTYDLFGTTRCQLYEPLNGTLKKDAVVLFHCYVPGAKDVKLWIDSNQSKIEGYKDPIFKSEAKVGTKDVTIHANYGQKSSYDGLIRYSVK